MQPYLGPPWIDSHPLWAVDVFHHAPPIHGIQNTEIQKKFFVTSSLLYSIDVWTRSIQFPRVLHGLLQVLLTSSLGGHLFLTDGWTRSKHPVPPCTTRPATSLADGEFRLSLVPEKSYILQRMLIYNIFKTLRASLQVDTIQIHVTFWVLFQFSLNHHLNWINNS